VRWWNDGRGGQGYLFLVLPPFARRGILFVSGLFRLPYFPSRLPVSSQQSRKHTPRYSSTYIKAKRQHLSHHDQSLISHPVVRSDKRLNQPQCSSSSRPSTNHHTDLRQHDSRTSSSSQPSALDLALRLFHTRRPQRCICSISLAATHQGSEDPHRTKGRNTCSPTITHRSLLFSSSLIHQGLAPTSGRIHIMFDPN